MEVISLTSPGVLLAAKSPCAILFLMSLQQMQTADCPSHLIRMVCALLRQPALTLRGVSGRLPRQPDCSWVYHMSRHGSRPSGSFYNVLIGFKLLCGAFLLDQGKQRTFECRMVVDGKVFTHILKKLSHSRSNF